MPHTKIKSLSVLSLISNQFTCPDNKNNFDPDIKPSQFQPSHINQVNSDPFTKIKSISMPTGNQVNFVPYTKTKSTSTTHARTKSIKPHAESKSFSPRTKKSQRWSPHWNQVNFHQYTKTKLFSGRTPKQVIFDRPILVFACITPQSCIRHDSCTPTRSYNGTSYVS